MVQKQLKRQIELNVQMHKYSLPMYCIQIYVEAFLIHYVPNRNYLCFCYRITRELRIIDIDNMTFYDKSYFLYTDLKINDCLSL